MQESVVVSTNEDEATHLKTVEYSPRVEELALARVLVGPRQNIIGCSSHFVEEGRTVRCVVNRSTSSGRA